MRASRQITEFSISTPVPETHLYEIEMRIALFSKAVTRFELVLPAWTPGSYAIRDYARNVRDLEVRDAGGKVLAVRKRDKSRWEASLAAPGSRGPFVARYRVYANELTVRTSHLDASHAYGNGASLFFYVEGRKKEPQTLRFDLPRRWRVSIALPRRGGRFWARDYDELVDSPFECGTHRILSFQVLGKPHTLALWGSGNEEPDRLVRDLTRIVRAAGRLFGGLPYERYLFIVHVAHGASGGLEHRSSQTAGVSPWRFRPESSYHDALSLFSHELFHAWNVKRIHPEAMGPFDYTREVYTRDLWAMEGITSYYEGLLLVRAGLIQPERLLARWAQKLKEHRENPGTVVQSAELASFDAWIRFYHPDENSSNVSESYYRRGALTGLALDLTLRQRTGGRKSLDDVLRLLWSEFGRAGRGYPEGAWEAAVGRATGVPRRTIKAFFDRHVRGVAALPLEKLLPAFGLRLDQKPEKEDGEKGSPSGKGAERVHQKADFGWKTKTERERLVVSEVLEHRAAWKAGISAGDELVAFDGVRVDEDELKRILRDVRPGTKMVVSLFRRARLLEIPLILGARRAFTYEVVKDAKARAGARTLYQGWLGNPFRGRA